MFLEDGGFSDLFPEEGKKIISSCIGILLFIPIASTKGLRTPHVFSTQRRISLMGLL